MIMMYVFFVPNSHSHLFNKFEIHTMYSHTHSSPLSLHTYWTLEPQGRRDRWIVHLDVDSFYVSCEIMRDASLRNKPVAVSQFNSGGFVAVSREARAMGVRKGDGIGKNGQKELAFFKDRPDALLSSVLKRCPDLKILPMDTDYYRKCTNLLERTLENFTLWKITSRLHYKIRKKPFKNFGL